MVTCTSGTLLPAQLRMYSPYQSQVLEETTIVFVVAKAFFPSDVSKSYILVDATHLYPVPGKPNQGDYESHVPRFENTFVFALREVKGEPKTEEDRSCLFCIGISEYI